LLDNSEVSGCYPADLIANPGDWSAYPSKVLNKHPHPEMIKRFIGFSFAKGLALLALWSMVSIVRCPPERQTNVA
jgi:hypothetical protein